MQCLLGAQETLSIIPPLFCHRGALIAIYNVARMLGRLHLTLLHMYKPSSQWNWTQGYLPMYQIFLAEM